MALLTDTKAKAMKPGDKQIAHGGITGLALEPSATKGCGKWIFRYVSPTSGKRRKMGLGTYPEVSIAEAGKAAQTYRVQLSEGLDPLDVKNATSTAPTIPSFQEAAELIHKELLPGWKNFKHGQQWINTLTQYAFPTLAKLPLNQIQPRHIADTLRPIWLEKAETAGRVKQRLHAVMAWGWAHGYCQANPVDVVNHLLPQQPGKANRTEHQPAMPWRDIPSFVAKSLRPSAQSDVTRGIVELLILTACRSGEIRGMRWSEVDWENAIWTIPATRMKSKQLHRVPLSDRAIEILKSLHGLHADLVFPSPRVQTQLSDMALTLFLRRENASSNTVGRLATAHGFRSSFRDWCSEQGYPRDLAERALAHAIQNKVEAAYHRTDLLEQRRPMMQAWSDFVTTKTQNQSMSAAFK